MKTKIFYSLIFVASLTMLGVYSGFYYLVSNLPYIPGDLRELVYAQSTRIYADDGSLILKLGGQSYVTLDKISPHFQHAIIATEDTDFLKHHGIDTFSNARAFYNWLFKKRRLGGASTISQQLAKNLFFPHHRSFMRKLKDMLMAMQLESMFSKKELFEAFANLIYFGGTAYGIEDASRQFFNKNAQDLSVSEAALLAGIINAPYGLNPFFNPEAAKNRQLLVLRRMYEDGYIDLPAYESARMDTLTYVSRARKSNDFTDYVLSLAIKKYGKEAVYFGGLKIFTTLDQDLQKIAEAEVAAGLQRLESELDSTEKKLQGAMAVISISTGEVKALVGARRHMPGGFNRATSANRHVGSGIKPFLYYAALEQLEFAPNSVLNDQLMSYKLPTGKRYRPRNFTNNYRGPVTMKYALMNSINSIAVQLGSQLTPGKLVETIRRFGVTTKLDEVLSLSLGTSGVAPVEMAAAYAIFARNGVFFEPSFIKRVEDINGIVIDRGGLQFGRTLLDPQKSYQILDMMQGVVESGTARAVRAAGFTGAAAGKTGTTYDFTDAWFNGITSSLAASVWVGYDRKLQLRLKNRRGATGGYAAAPIWGRFMTRASDRYPARDFKMPPGLKQVRVDRRMGWRSFDPDSSISIIIPEEDEVPERTGAFFDDLFNNERDRDRRN